MLRIKLIGKIKSSHLRADKRIVKSAAFKYQTHRIISFTLPATPLNVLFNGTLDDGGSDGSGGGAKLTYHACVLSLIMQYDYFSAGTRSIRFCFHFVVIVCISFF